MWKVTDNASAKELRVEDKVTDSLTGNKHYHFWSPTAVNFDLVQEVSDLPAGNYKFTISIMGGDGGTTDIYSFVLVDGVEVTRKKLEITVWNEWHTETIENFAVAAGQKVTVGIHVECEGAGNGAWGKIDDALLNSVK